MSFVSQSGGGTVFSHEDIEGMDGASLGWWWHTEEDTLDKVDAEILAKSMKVFAAYVVQLSNLEVLPLEFTTFSEEIVEQLNNIQEENKDTIIALSPLITAAERLERLTKELENLREKLTNGSNTMRSDHGRVKRLVNQCLMRLSRKLLPVLNTVAGKYGQDSYGLSVLEHPIPSLYPLHKLAKMDPETQEYKLLVTNYLRKRNWVFDSLKESIEIVENTIITLKTEI